MIAELYDKDLIQIKGSGKVEFCWGFPPWRNRDYLEGFVKDNKFYYPKGGIPIFGRIPVISILFGAKTKDPNAAVDMTQVLNIVNDYKILYKVVNDKWEQLPIKKDIEGQKSPINIKEFVQGIELDHMRAKDIIKKPMELLQIATMILTILCILTAIGLALESNSVYTAVSNKLDQYSGTMTEQNAQLVNLTKIVSTQSRNTSQIEQALLKFLQFHTPA